MKAIVQDRYGRADDLALRDIDRPAVGRDDVLVRVRAASVHPDVWHVVTGRPYVLRLMGAGLRRPKQRVPGTDLAGVVEAVGEAVAEFAPGDEVFGESVTRYQWRNGGAYAEYAAVPAERLARKPAGVSFEQAAAVPTSGLIALRALRTEGRLQAGQHVLVNGAAGGVGSIAVQLAKASGAQVTGVDTAEKLELVRSLGADHVLDAGEDVTGGDARYDLVVDVPGNRPYGEWRRVIAPGGRYVLIGHDAYGREGRRVLGSLPRFIGLVTRSLFDRRLPPLNISMPDRRASMAVLRELLEAGKLTPPIDRTFPLSEVPEAIRYLASGAARGKIVITV